MFLTPVSRLYSLFPLFLGLYKTEGKGEIAEKKEMTEIPRNSRVKERGSSATEYSLLIAFGVILLLALVHPLLSHFQDILSLDWLKDL